MKRRFEKRLTTWMAVLSVACWGATAMASSVAILNSEAVSFTGIDSVGPLGDAANITTMATLTGGFVANNIIVTGTLTEVQTGTFASEADIAITAPGGSVTANGSTTGGYTGTIATGPTATTIPTPFDPAGLVSFEFFESFNDGPGPDQTWDDVTIEFQEIGIMNGMADLGTLPSDGTMVTTSGFNVSGGLDFYDFVVTAPGVAPGGYLNIQTFDNGTGDTIDSEIGLFDSAGILVAFDDDGQGSAGGTLYSMLSFGAADPLTPMPPFGSDALPGEDGATLPAGAYTLVVGGFDTNFEDLTIGVSTIGEVTAGTSSGDYGLKVTYQVPEPAAGMMTLLLAVLGLARRIRRR